MKSILVLFALLVAGCSTAPVEVKLPVSHRMATSYFDGETAITWNSEAGQTYTVYFTDAPHGTEPNWKPLPQANHLRGTGQAITIKDKVSSKTVRRYLLFAGDQHP
jgi:hypothetical protein